MTINLCTIYAELHLIFDNDFDVYTIDTKLGIKSYDCKNKSETRINPFTKKRNPGYWTIKTQTINDYELKPILDELLEIVIDKIDTIKNLLDSNGGSAKVDIVPSFSGEITPALCFHREFLKVMAHLNAEIDIDMYYSNSGD